MASEVHQSEAKTSKKRDGHKWFSLRFSNPYWEEEALAAEGIHCKRRCYYWEIELNSTPLGWYVLIDMFPWRQAPKITQKHIIACKIQKLSAVSNIKVNSIVHSSTLESSCSKGHSNFSTTTSLSLDAMSSYSTPCQAKSINTGKLR
jgi:hypothetical protein